MLELKEIIKLYPKSLQHYKSFLLREYLQHKILEIIYSSEYTNGLVFMGGTALRIVNDNQRFSEDLDFDNKGLSPEKFISLSELIKKKLEEEGFDVEIRNVLKNAFHCHIRFTHLLFKEGLSGHKSQKILIQLDTESQNFSYQPDTFILNRFDVFTEIFVTPLHILLSQKLYALLNRKRAKGRDFFDVVFLLSKTLPDYPYLKVKTGIENAEQLRKSVLEKCDALDMKELLEDVRPFLFNETQHKKILLFANYFKQAKLD